MDLPRLLCSVPRVVRLLRGEEGERPRYLREHRGQADPGLGQIPVRQEQAFLPSRAGGLHGETEERQAEGLRDHDPEEHEDVALQEEIPGDSEGDFADTAVGPWLSGQEKGTALYYVLLCAVLYLSYAIT